MIAVSGVMAFFALIISFIACAGLPILAASSFCVIPRASSSSSSTSPGGIGRSESARGSLVVIVIAHLLYQYAGFRVALRHDEAPFAR